MAKAILFIYLIISFSIISAQITFDSSSFYKCFSQLELNDNSIIMMGEHHGDINFMNTELLVIKQLASKGFNTIYVEGGNSEAEIFNNYFKTNNIKLLKYSRARGTKFLQYLNDIKQINPNISFKGYDFERPQTIAAILSLWFENKNIEDVDIHKLIHKLSKIKSRSIKNVKKNKPKTDKILAKLRASLRNKELEYQKILGNHFEAFKKILTNSIEPDFATRDQAFAKLILENEKEEGLEKSIFIMGRDHMTEEESFVPLLLEKLPKKYNISCIVLITNNNFDEFREVYYDSNETRKIGLFKIPEQKVIPTEYDKLKVIIGIFYNHYKGISISN